MQKTLARLFGRSPFTPLQTHMAKVALCVEEIVPLFEALDRQDFSLIEQSAKKISKLEHEADLAKNDIRNNLPTGLFMPIARASLLEILALQDNIADKAEDVAISLTLRELELKPDFAEEFHLFVQKNLDTFRGVQKIIQEMSELLETSFGGSEAEKVRSMVEKVAYKEHEVDVMQRGLLKTVFSIGDSLPAPDFYLWMQVIHGVAAISDVSEKLAYRVRMTLDIK